MKRYSPFVFVLLAIALVSVACGGTVANIAPTATHPPTDAPAPSPTSVPTETLPPPPTKTAIAPPTSIPTEPPPTVTPTDTVAPPTPTPAPDWLLVEGRTADGLPTLGNPDAPVVVLDYSDFL